MENLSDRLKHSALSDAFSPIRFNTVIYCRSELGAPWGFRVGKKPACSFHVITRGECVLQIQGDDKPVRVREGDLVILPHGSEHTMSDAPESKVTRLETLLKKYPIGDRKTLECGGDGEMTSILCGGFSLEAETRLPSNLPNVIHISAQDSGATQWARSLMKFLVREALASRPGAETVVSRLVEALFIHALGIYTAQGSLDDPGWISALQDKQVGIALALIHRRPDRSWTLRQLASKSGLSRTAFINQFSKTVGETPLQYLTRFRMEQAKRLLKSNSLSIAQIASNVGYQSKEAFARAFKRVTGRSPGHYRRNPSN